MGKIGYFNIVGSNIKPGKNKLEDLNVKLMFDDRDIVEEMKDVVQPVCAGCVMTTNGKVLVINKTTKSTGKISPEKNKSLLYIGGHLDKDDFIDDSVLETFRQGMKREIFEELGIRVETLVKPIVVYTPITKKSSKHVGIIFPVVLENEIIPNFTDGKATFVEINQLSEIDNFESWSQVVSENIVQKVFNEFQNHEL